MRALILSDLHIEHAPFERPRGDYDLVILAGDIHNGVRSLVWARETFPDHRIVQIAGNHEYYDHVLQTSREAMRAAAGSLQIDYLDDSSVVIGDIEFFGCTLWTDFRVFEAPGRALTLSQQDAMTGNLGLIADYFAIKVERQRDGAQALRAFQPADALMMHEQSRQWLDEALAASTRRVKVVVSHHLPSFRSVSPRFQNSVTNAAFVSDLDEMVGRADLWIHGHTHSSNRYQVGRATVLANPRGYPSRREPGLFENRQFQPELIVPLTGADHRLGAAVRAETR